MWSQDEDYTYWDVETNRYVEPRDTYTKHELPGLVIHEDTGLVVSKRHIGDFEMSSLFKLIHGDIKVTVNV